MGIVEVQADTRQPEGRRSSFSLPQFMTIAGVTCMLVILAAVSIVAYDQWRRVVEATSERVVAQSFFIADHAARILESSDLALQKAAQIVEGKTWSEIRGSAEDRARLIDIVRELPYVDNIWLTDDRRRIQLSTYSLASEGVPDTSSALFEVDDAILNIGPATEGRITGGLVFPVYRRLVGPDGNFSGTISASISVGHFDEFWRRLSFQSGTTVHMFREEDQAILASFPSTSLESEGFSESLAAIIESGPDGGEYAISRGEGAAVRYGAYEQVGSFPVYVRVSVARSEMVAAWISGSRPYFLFAGSALLALVCLTAFARHQANRTVHGTNLLRSEVARRTKDLTAETRAMEILIVASRRLSGQTDVDDIIQSVVNDGRLIIGAQFGTFFYDRKEVNPEGVPTIDFHVVSGAQKADFEKLDKPRRTSIFERSFRDLKTVRSPDITLDPEFGEMSDGRGFPPGHPRIRSYLAIPVVSSSGQAHGAMLFGDLRIDAFSLRHERLLEGLAAQAAIAIDNARLLSETLQENEARRLSEERQKVLVREMHHRVKNSLATVRAIANLSARSATDIESFTHGFGLRLSAMAQTHTLLTEAATQRASIAELVEQETQAYRDVDGLTIHIDGPSVDVCSAKAVPLGMAFHELATNAAKYGSLSVENGSLSITWRLFEDDGKQMIELVWQERNGPAVVPPSRRGFGTTLLDKVLAVQLEATIATSYDAEGVTCVITFPSKGLESDGERA